MNGTPPIIYIGTFTCEKTAWNVQKNTKFCYCMLITMEVVGQQVGEKHAG